MHDSGRCDVPSPGDGFVKVVARQWYGGGLPDDGSIVCWGGS